MFRVEHSDETYVDYCHCMLCNGNFIGAACQVKFCPLCGKAVEQHKCRPSDMPRWVWEHPRKHEIRSWHGTSKQLNPDWEVYKKYVHNDPDLDEEGFKYDQVLKNMNAQQVLRFVRIYFCDRSAFYMTIYRIRPVGSNVGGLIVTVPQEERKWEKKLVS